MGEVYKAFDDRLDRWVAIKRIRPDKEQADDHRVRFRREARAAARLNHSAIVHIYDIFQDGDSDCIVMELVEGRGLDVVLQDGPLTPRRAAEVGRQIASGLAEAHRKGILHRDLKTENIILSDQGDAKILDFGLAKPMVQGDLDASLTGQGQVVGTSRAMSPEYVGGDDVDHRADLFSLGVLLYEAVTGQSPFKSHNTLATLKRIILHQQPPASIINPTVPEELSELIDGLLEKEPKDRISTAQEVVERLDEAVFLYGSGSGERPPLSSSRITQHLDRSALPSLKTRRRGLWIAAAVALAIVVAVAGTILIRHDPTTQEQLAFEAEDSIVIGDFVNRTGEAVFDEGLDLVFRVGIEQGRYAKVLSETQVQNALRRMELDTVTVIDREKGIEIAQRENAKAFVVGTIVKVGTAYSLTGEIFDPGTGQVVFAESRSESDQSKILDSLGEVIDAIRANLGESAGEKAQPQQLAKVTTPNLEALKAYSLGTTRLRNSQYDKAVIFLERAIELDPAFAMAHAKLGTAYRNASRDLEKATFHYQEALGLSDRLTTSEELYVKGWMATWLGSPQEMVDAWTLMTESVPDSLEAHHNLGMAYWNHLNRFSDARNQFERAAELTTNTPQRMLVNYHLGHCQLAVGDFQAAIVTFEPTREVVSSVGLALPHLAMGRSLAEVNAILGPDPAAGLLNPNDRLDRDFVRVATQIHHGDIAAASLDTSVAIEFAEREGQSYWERTFRLLALSILLDRGETGAIRNLLRESIDLASRSSEADEDSLHLTPFLASLGKIALRAGKGSMAPEMLTRMGGLPSRDTPIGVAYLKMFQAEFEAAEGNEEAAIGLLDDGLASLDSIQLRESVAWIAAQAGDLERAVKEYTWLEQQAGRVLAECRENCFDRLSNVFIQATASYRAAALNERLGRMDDARNGYAKFLEDWHGSDDRIVREATRRLEALGGANSAAEANSALENSPESANSAVER